MHRVGGALIYLIRDIMYGEKLIIAFAIRQVCMGEDDITNVVMSHYLLRNQKKMRRPYVFPDVSIRMFES